MSQINKLTALTLLASGMGALAMAADVQAEEALYDALSGGKVSFSARLRYEGVEQNNGLKDAEALTLRTTLGYKTGAFHGFSGFIELEDVSDIGAARFNSTTNGKAEYPVVADPDGTEVNQAYLAYNGIDTKVKFGRQELSYRDAPFHRFIGNVLWRQNHQSFDALSISNTSLADTRISYAYINKAHTIFGEDRDAAAAFIENGDIDMDTHLFNFRYSGLPVGKLEAYAYLLDYADAPDANAVSRATYGIRLNGARALTDAAKVIYATEYATQNDYASGDMDQQDYYFLELGGNYQGWLTKVSYEVQEGDGTFSFRTPLGTNHAFQGWADQFLNTPAQGLKDLSFTLVGNLTSAKLVVAYHDFETDKGSLNAGNELNILLQRTFQQHYIVGVGYADYNADEEFPSLVNTEKLWVYGQVKF